MSARSLGPNFARCLVWAESGGHKRIVDVTPRKGGGWRVGLAEFRPCELMFWSGSGATIELAAEEALRDLVERGPLRLTGGGVVSAVSEYERHLRSLVGTEALRLLAKLELQKRQVEALESIARSLGLMVEDTEEGLIDGHFAEVEVAS